MLNLNEVVLCGNVGQEPEIKITGSGSQLTILRLATTRYYNGETYTDWHDVVAWGDKIANYVQDHVHKGSHLYVAGRLNTRSWEADDGSKRYKTEVVAFRVQLVGKRDDTERVNRGDQDQYSNNVGTSAPAKTSPPSDDGPTAEERAQARTAAESMAPSGREALSKLLGYDPLEDDGDDLPF